MARSRTGLTLLELLVVMGILLLVAGLGAGVWFSAANTSRLTATEHLVAGLVRQARHTARTSGLPVTLMISQGERTITGSQGTMLWSEDGEGDLPFALPAGGSATAGAWRAQGRTGLGLRIAEDLLDHPTGPLTVRLERERRLAGRGGLADGFDLGISVWLPPAKDVSSTIPVPVLLITSDGETSPPIAAQAVAGLLVRPVDLSLIRPAPAFSSDPTIPPAIRRWDVVGWIRTPEGTFRTTLIGSDPLATTAGGISGGGWCDLGLLWTGGTLALQVDGATSAEVPATGRQLATDPGNPACIWLGSATIDPLLAWYPQTPPPTATTEFARMPVGWRVDRLHVAALGSGQAGQLPAGIAPITNALVTCLPDGRITGASTLAFQGEFDRADSMTVVTIASDGTVSSTKASVR